MQCQPWFYLRLFAYGFFWLSEGAYSFSRDSVCKHPLRLTGLRILTLEPERLKNRKATPEMNPGMGGFSQTLKLLVVSDVGRRNGLLSSKRAR